MRLSFDTPAQHVQAFAHLNDFNVAHANLALTNPKYRAQLKPIELLLADVMPLNELRRAVSLTKPVHVTIGPLTGTREENEIALRHVQLVTECEIALVVPVDNVDLAQLALAEDVSVIAIPEAVGDRVRWAHEIQLNAPEPLWFHFMEIDGPEELKLLHEWSLSENQVSLHTAWPIRQAAGEVYPLEGLPASELAEALALATAMREAVASPVPQRA